MVQEFHRINLYVIPSREAAGRRTHMIRRLLLLLLPLDSKVDSWPDSQLVVDQIRQFSRKQVFVSPSTSSLLHSKQSRQSIFSCKLSNFRFNEMLIYQQFSLLPAGILVFGTTCIQIRVHISRCTDMNKTKRIRKKISNNFKELWQDWIGHRGPVWHPFNCQGPKYVHQQKKNRINGDEGVFLN